MNEEIIQKIQPNTIILFELAYDENSTKYNSRGLAKKTFRLRCEQVYKYHILFRMIEEPYLKVDIQMVDLLHKGVVIVDE